MADMFPVIAADIPAQVGTDIGRTPAFDSAHSAFLTCDGAIVERTGVAAVQQWFDLMLRQQIDKVPIYRTGSATKIGIDRGVIGQHLPDGMAAAEIERNVRETADYCPAVRAIRDLTVQRVRRTCQVTFTAVLYTAETVEISINV